MRSKTQNSQEAVPSHVLLSPLDNSNILNFINFNNLGSSTLSSSSAFKKIQFSTKTNPQNLFQSSDDFSLKYNKIYDLYLSDMNSQDNTSYGVSRQHNYSSSKSITNNFSTQLDNASVNKLLSYNYNFGNNSFKQTNPSDLETSNFENNNYNNINMSNSVISSPEYSNTEDKSLMDGREFATQTLSNQSYIEDNVYGSDSVVSLQTKSSNLNSSNNMFDYSILYKDFLNKSPNQQVLSSDMNIRNIDNLNPNKVNYNISGSNIGLNSYMGSFNSSLNQSSNSNILGIIPSSNTVFPDSHMPSSAMGSKMPNIGYDKFSESGSNSTLMTSKDELAPNFVFTPFWSSV